MSDNIPDNGQNVKVNGALSEYLEVGATLLEVVGKKPIREDWPTIPSLSEEKAAECIRKGRNFGHRLDDYIALDVDPRHFKTVDGVKDNPLRRLAKDLGVDFKKFFIVETGGGGLHVVTKLPAGVDPKTLKSMLKDYPGIQFKSGPGHQLVAVGSTHPETGKLYKKHPGSVSLKDTPEAPSALLDMLRKPPPSNKPPSGNEIPLGLAQEVLGTISSEEFRERDDWLRFILMMHQATEANPDVLNALLAFFREDPKFDTAEDEADGAAVWENADLDKPGGLGLGSLISLVSEFEVPELVAKLAEYLPTKFEKVPDAEPPLATNDFEPEPLGRPEAEPTSFPPDLTARTGLVGAAAEAAAAQVGVPVEMAFMVALATAAAAVQGHVDVELPFENGRRPTSLHVLIEAKSGDRKTSLDRTLGKAFGDRQVELRRQYAFEKPLYDRAIKDWEARRKKLVTASHNPEADLAALEALQKHDEAEPHAPLDPTIIFQEASMQGLLKYFGKGQPSRFLSSSEAGTFLGGYAMGDDNRLFTASVWSSLWDAGSLTRILAGEGTIHVHAKRLGVCLAGQPEAVDGFLNDPMLHGQGLLARMLMLAPPSLRGTRLIGSRPEPNARDKAALTAFTDRLRTILDWPHPLVEGTRNELDQPLLGMQPGAQKCWEEYYDLVEAGMAKGGKFEHSSAFASKMLEQAGRIAAVIATMEAYDPAVGSMLGRADIITAEHMEAAIDLMDYLFLEQARLVGRAKVSAETTRDQGLVDWLQNVWEFEFVSMPDIYRNGPGAFRNKAQAERSVRVLEDHGYLLRSGPRVIDGHRRRVTWKIWGKGAEG